MSVPDQTAISGVVSARSHSSAKTSKASFTYNQFATASDSPRRVCAWIARSTPAMSSAPIPHATSRRHTLPDLGTARTPPPRPPPAPGVSTASYEGFGSVGPFLSARAPFLPSTESPVCDAQGRTRSPGARAGRRRRRFAAGEVVAGAGTDEVGRARPVKRRTPVKPRPPVERIVQLSKCHCGPGRDGRQPQEDSAEATRKTKKMGTLQAQVWRRLRPGSTLSNLSRSMGTPDEAALGTVRLTSSFAKTGTATDPARPQGISWAGTKHASRRPRRPR